MLPKLTICRKLLDRLSKVKKESYGSLYGIHYNDNNTILLVGVHFAENCNETETLRIRNSYPAEIYMCGVVSIGDAALNNDAKNIMNDVFITDNPIYLTASIGSKTVTAHYLVNDKCEPTNYETIPEDQVVSQFIYTRLQTKLEIVCDFKVDAIREAFANLRKEVGTGQVAFTFPKTNIYLMGQSVETGLAGLSGQPDVSELCDFIAGDGNDLVSLPKHKRTTKSEIEVLNVTMLKSVTRDVHDGQPTHAPIIEVNKKTYDCLIMSLKLDALSMIHRHTKVIVMHAILVESLLRNVHLIEAALLNEYNHHIGESPKVSCPETFHFFPEQCAHFITRVYCKDVDEKLLRIGRERLHQQLLLPMDRPLFKRGNRYRFKNMYFANSPLINPHVGLAATTNGGEVFLVRGKYGYHHYMQDNMNDNGWGCAYRSLQTVVSWLKMQGYTDKPIPDHKQIQKCLVDIGDKPVNFIGSNKWIGSMEVSFILETMYGVTSRILTVTSGAEMETIGPDLAAHFKTHGSPVMIGGGVLAHTIIGVDCNNETGSVKFLILDPHYTGAEDLKTIQSKGWCGWKGLNFWDKTAYYNMCLPQIPKCV